MEDPEILFVDQSGQLGGAELCLADIVSGFPHSKVVLFAEGPFVNLLQSRDTKVSVLAMPQVLARATKRSSLPALALGIPALLGYVHDLRKASHLSSLLYLNTAKALLHGVAANMGRATPLVFHLHDLLDPRHFSAANIRLLVAAANRTNAVIANSHATAEGFARAGGRTTVHVIPNGFDPRSFDAVKEDTAQALRSQLNPENRCVAAIFGRISRWKGQDVLIRAAASVPNLAVWIVGDALFTDDDRTYAGELRSLVAAESLEDRVKFLGFRGDVPELMRAADIVVHTSVAPEPFGRVLVEAMMARRPVVAADAGGPREIVEAEATGLLTPPGDAGALAGALTKLAKSSDLREEMGRLGRARAMEHFSLEKVVAQTREVINPLLSRA